MRRVPALEAVGVAERQESRAKHFGDISPVLDQFSAGAEEPTKSLPFGAILDEVGERGEEIDSPEQRPYDGVAAKRQDFFVRLERRFGFDEGEAMQRVAATNAARRIVHEAEVEVMVEEVVLLALQKPRRGLQLAPYGDQVFKRQEVGGGVKLIALLRASNRSQPRIRIFANAHGFLNRVVALRPNPSTKSCAKVTRAQSGFGFGPRLTKT